MNSDITPTIVLDDDDEKRQKIKNAETTESTKSPFFTKNVHAESDTSCQAVASTSADMTMMGVSGAAVLADGESQKYDMSPESDPTDDSQDTLDEESGIKLDIPTKKPSRAKPESWKGTKLSELNTTPSCTGEIKPLRVSEAHTVLFKLPYQFTGSNTCPPYPHPSNFSDKWDGDHVRMPCSNQNEYPVEGKDGKMNLRRRWELIEEALRSDIPGPYELEEAILTYNQRYASKWNFTAMHHFFTEYIPKKQRMEFFDETLKKMAILALKLHWLCTQAIPLLKRGKTRSLTLSQEQIACLLANAFFCTFPRRNARARHAEYSTYPDINFNSLFHGQPNKRKMEKLRCIIHYFKRVLIKMPVGVVTFKRQVLEKFPRWDELEICLGKLHVSSSGTIEDDGKGMLQADFANKYIGGGVLGHGCVQEEIRFLICPEMIVTRLFTEVLDKNESLIMTGCERFSNYEGYANSFEFAGDYVDETSRDSNGRLCTEVVAIDALIIHDYKKQFQNWCVRRELNKAYCGFYSTDGPQHLSAVCTGNWGCGAFGGDKRLKALIQLMAAAVAKRDVCYFTFDDTILTSDLYKIHLYLTKENPLEIGNIMKLMDQYFRNVCSRSFGRPKMDLFEYIVGVFEGSLDDTTDEDFSEDSHEAHFWDESVDYSKIAETSDGKKLKTEMSVDYKADTP